MFKFLKSLMVGIVATVVLSGCVATSNEATAPSMANVVEARGAEKIMVEAIESKDYFKVNRLLTSSLAKIFTPDNFVAFCQELDKCGEYQGATFITELILPVFKTGVWKFTYTRELEDGSSVTHERLLLITTGKLDNQYIITGLAVQ